MASLAFGDDDNNNNNNNNNNYSNLNIGYAAAGKMMRTRSEESRMKRDSEIAKKLQEQFNQEDMEAIERRRKEIEEDDLTLLDLLAPYRTHINSYLDKKFRNTLGTNCTITCIERNYHSLPGQPMYNNFVTAWQSVSNETIQYMFHGTNENNITSICQNGLDPTRRGQHGQAYGQ
jgi:hypothetical protein